MKVNAEVAFILVFLRLQYPTVFHKIGHIVLIYQKQIASADELMTIKVLLL